MDSTRRTILARGCCGCISADLRNAPNGQSTGPVEVDRPWESYADDQLGLMDISA